MAVTSMAVTSMAVTSIAAQAHRLAGELLLDAEKHAKANGANNNEIVPPKKR